MVEQVTSRLQLPLMAAGQAQKEVTHNEALLLIDSPASWPGTSVVSPAMLQVSTPKASVLPAAVA